jgi:hypothetical protein
VKNISNLWNKREREKEREREREREKERKIKANQLINKLTNISLLNVELNKRKRDKNDKYLYSLINNEKINK